MGFQDVAFLPSKASLPTTFHTNCGRGESLRTTTCPKTVVGGKQGRGPCNNTFAPTRSLFVCQSNFMETIRL